MKKKQRSIPVQYVIPQTMVDQLPNMYKIYVRFMTLKHFSFQLSLLPLVFSLFLRSSKVFFFIKVQRKEGKTTLQEIVN